MLLAGCAEDRSGGPAPITDQISGMNFEAPAEPTPVTQQTLEPAPGGVRVQGARIYTSPDTTQRRPASAGASVTPDGAGVQLNFENADLREVVRVILGDVLQRSFTIDPAVQGTVSLTTSASMSRDALLSTLETVLRQNNAALVQEGNGYSVVQLANASGRPGVAQLGDSSVAIPPGYGVTLIPLRFVPAMTAMEFARPLIADPDDLRVDLAHNLLMVIGTAPERQTVVDTIADVDVDWLSGRAVGIFPLQQTTPEAIIPELETIFGLASGGAAQSSPDFQPVRFLAMQRLNAVLVVASQAEAVQRARQWVARLDSGSSIGTQLYIYQLQYAQAAPMAATLNAVVSDLAGAGLPVTSSPTGGTAPGAAPPAGATDAAPAPDQPNISLAQAARMDLGSAAAGGAGGGGMASEVKIVPNISNNTLVIRATPDVYRMIEAAARRLDTPPGQVVIDATIAEVQLNDRLKYGVQYFFESGDFSFGFSTSSTLRRPNPSLPGFTFLFNNSNNKIVALDALSSVTDVRVMSSPTLVVQDNREATLNVGNEVPVTTRSAVADDTTARTVNTIEYRETGVILNVKPRISGNNSVALEISQEVSSIANSDSATEEERLTPTINQRKVQSVVSVRNGQTVVIGGLIQEQEDRSRAGIPLLSDIPGIGDLFAYNNRSGQRTELVVFITPRVVRNSDDAAVISREIRDRMRSMGGRQGNQPIVPGPIDRTTIRGLGRNPDPAPTTIPAPPPNEPTG